MAQYRAAPTLHPLAYAREAERCAKLERLALAEYDREQARRLRRLRQECMERAGRDA